MALAKVLPRGQITIPQEVREAVGLVPGTTVQVDVTGPDTIRITVIPQRSISEWISRYQVVEPVDYPELRTRAESAEAEEAVRRIERQTRDVVEAARE